MDRQQQEADPVAVIDQWFHTNSDGLWEHQFGVKIESCDNPGWLIKFESLSLPGKHDMELFERLRREYRAEVTADEDSITVFNKSLQNGLLAAAELIRTSLNVARVKKKK